MHEEQQEGRSPVLPRQGIADETGMPTRRNDGDDVEAHLRALRSGEAPGDDENPGFAALRRPDAGDDVEGHVMTPPDNRSGETESGAEEGGEGLRAL